MLARNIHDEDTIELQLSPAELETLTRAAETVEAADQAPPPTATLVSKAAPAAADTPAPPAAPEVACVAAPSSTSAPAAESVPARSGTAASVAEGVPRMPSPAAQPLPAPTRASAAPARTSTLWPVPATPAPAPRPPAPIAVERAPEMVPIDSSPPAAAPTRNGVQFLSLQVAAAFTAAVAALVALFYYWPTPGVPAPATGPAASPASITAPTHETAPLPPPEPPAVELTGNDPRPVRFANPFDSSEIFEFPPGTPYAEARDEVARTLIARARERGAAAPPSRQTTPTT